MPVTERAFLKRALQDYKGQWELHDGKMRQKPPMTAAHNRIAWRLLGFLFQQLDQSQFEARTNAGHVRVSPQHYYIPDVSVIPVELVLPQLDQLALEVYEAPLPLVVEVWSRSTGEYDVQTKLLEYQRRGDAEIWLIHPYE